MQRRIILLAGVVCLVMFCWVGYENKTDDWFSRNERWRVGLPFSPWYDSWEWSNAIEGGGESHLHVWSLSTLSLIYGLLCLGLGCWKKAWEPLEKAGRSQPLAQ